MGDLIPQAHGGALRPFAPGTGETRGYAARGGSFKAARKAALQRLSEVTPAAIEETIRLALESPDDRVRTINLQAIRDTVLGKPTERPGEAEDGRIVNIEHLSAENFQRLSDALAVVYELTGQGPGALAAAE